MKQNSFNQTLMMSQTIAWCQLNSPIITSVRWLLRAVLYRVEKTTWLWYLIINRQKLTWRNPLKVLHKKARLDKKRMHKWLMLREYTGITQCKDLLVSKILDTISRLKIQCRTLQTHHIKRKEVAHSWMMRMYLIIIREYFNRPKYNISL